MRRRGFLAAGVAALAGLAAHTLPLPQVQPGPQPDVPLPPKPKEGPYVKPADVNPGLAANTFYERDDWSQRLAERREKHSQRLANELEEKMWGPLPRTRPWPYANTYYVKTAGPVTITPPAESKLPTMILTKAPSGEYQMDYRRVGCDEGIFSKPPAA